MYGWMQRDDIYIYIYICIHVCMHVYIYIHTRIAMHPGNVYSGGMVGLIFSFERISTVLNPQKDFC